MVWLQSTTNTHAESDMNGAKDLGCRCSYHEFKTVIHAQNKTMETDYVIISFGALI